MRGVGWCGGFCADEDAAGSPAAAGLPELVAMVWPCGIGGMGKWSGLHDMWDPNSSA